MAFCTHCGKQTPDSLPRCEHCGAQIEVSKVSKFGDTLMMPGPNDKKSANPLPPPKANPPFTPVPPQVKTPQNETWHDVFPAASSPGSLPPSTRPPSNLSAGVALHPTIPSEPPSFIGHTRRTKMWIWWGIGLAAFLAIACPITAIVIGIKIYEKVTDNGSDRFKAEMLRVSTTLTLGSIKASCGNDPSGQSASHYFFPKVQAALVPKACLVTNDVIEIFGHPDRSITELVNKTDSRSHIEALGLAADNCVRISNKSASIIGCNVPSGGFQLVELVNLEKIK